MSSWSRELDEAAELATRSGCWHVFLFYLLCGLAAIPTSFLVFSQVFTNAIPEHWCAPPPELEVLNLPEELLRNLTVPGQHGTYASCLAYVVDPRAVYAVLSDYVDERSEFVREKGALRMVNIRQLKPASGENETLEQIARIIDGIAAVRTGPAPCSYGWRFSSELYTSTLVTHFSLVCSQDWLPRTANTLFWVGSIFGNLFFGWMSDRYGRRPTILLMIYLEVPLAIAAAFPGTYWTYIGLRVAGGLFFPALYQLPFILALELMPPSKRNSAGVGFFVPYHAVRIYDGISDHVLLLNYAGIVVGMLFAAGMCLLAVVAFFLRDWFYLSLATSLPFVLLYGYYWLIPESPRWLVGRGRIAEAEKVLRDLARRNHIELPKGFLLELHKKIKEEEDAEAELKMLSINGHVTQDEVIDRRISNMLTFKPDLTKISEVEDNKDGIEKMIANEVAETVKKKSCSRNKVNEDECDDNISEESQLNSESNQRSTQTDTLRPPNIFRRKSMQLVSRMFVKDSEDELENKRIDEQNSEGDCKASPLDMCKYPNMRRKFCLLTFEWVALGVVYNSFSYNSPNLGVDDYLAFFIGGAVEIPSYFLAWRCMERLGRRWVLFTCLTISGLACLSCMFVPDAWPWITVSLVMLGRLCAAASFAVFYVQIGELLPTVLRAQAMGAASFISGLGLLAVPYIVHLANYSRSLPLIIMGVLSLAGGLTALFLPETLNQPLPQTLGDGEVFGRNFKLLSCVERGKK